MSTRLLPDSTQNRFAFFPYLIVFVVIFRQGVLSRLTSIHLESLLGEAKAFQQENFFEGQSMLLWHGPSIQQYHTRSNFVQHYIYTAIKLWHFPHVIHSEFATEDEKQWFIISTYMMTYLMMTNNKGRIRGRKIKPTRKLLTLCAFCCFLALWRKRYLVGNLA